MIDQIMVLTAAQRASLMRRSWTRVLLGGLGIVLVGLVGMLLTQVRPLSALSPGGRIIGMTMVWMGVWAWEPRLNVSPIFWTGVQGLADRRAGWAQTQTITLRAMGRVAWDDVLVADDGRRYPLMTAIPPLAAGTRLTLLISPRTRLVWAAMMDGGMQ